MKKLIALIMFMFLVLPVSANAGACERYWDELVGQCFVTTVDEVEFTVCFSDSCYGPCPSGQVILSYIDTQVIDGVEYTAEVEIPLIYLTDYNYVTIEGLEFVLIDGKLILLPENPLVFNVIVEED